MIYHSWPSIVGQEYEDAEGGDGDDRYEHRAGPTLGEQDLVSTTSDDDDDDDL